MGWWEIIAAAVIIPALVFLLGYFAGVGWSSAWFARKLRHHRDVLRDTERSINGAEEDKEV